MSNQQKPRDLFDLFCDCIYGQAQIQICLQFLLGLSFFFLFQIFWRTIVPSMTFEKDYLITNDRIVISSRPLWIPPTLQEDAIKHDSNLISYDRLSLLDPKLADHLMNAFRAEPWVREVRSVRLEYPAEVIIDAEFRQPVAFVETDSVIKDGISSRSTYQIDADGVLLPTDYLAAAVSTDPRSLHDYLWIEGISSTPIGIYGQLWGDPILYEAALLADFLRGCFKQLAIAVIHIPNDVKTEKQVVEKLSEERIWRLETVKGREIIWGSFPISDVIRIRSGSRTDYETAKQEAFQNQNQKLARLLDLAKGKSLDEIDEDLFPIDLTKSE